MLTMGRRAENTFPIAPQLAYFIKASGFSRADLCDQLDVDKQTLSNWVRGVTSPHSRDLAFICRTLGIEPGVLFRPLELTGAIA